MTDWQIFQLIFICRGSLLQNVHFSLLASFLQQNNNNNNQAQRAIVDKHPSSPEIMASTHSQIMLDLLEGRALRMGVNGKYLLALRNGEVILLSNNNEEMSGDKLLKDFFTKSFPANGGKYEGEAISLVKKTRRGFQVEIQSGESSGRITWLPPNRWHVSLRLQHLTDVLLGSIVVVECLFIF